MEAARLEQEVIISAIPPDMVDAIWSRVEIFIQLAVDESNNELCIDQIRQSLIDGDRVLIPIVEGCDIIAAFTVERIIYSTGKIVLNVVTVGGEGFIKWEDQISVVMLGIAKEYDCEEIYIIGRPGWKKLLAKRGFKVIHTTLSKKV